MNGLAVMVWLQTNHTITTTGFMFDAPLVPEQRADGLFEPPVGAERTPRSPLRESEAPMLRSNAAAADAPTN